MISIEAILVFVGRRDPSTMGCAALVLTFVAQTLEKKAVAHKGAVHIHHHPVLPLLMTEG